MKPSKNLCLGCMSDKGQSDVCPVCGWQEGDVPESPLFLLPGTVLNDRYLIGRVLGHGGFGITYLAWDLSLHIKLAVKEYLPQSLATRAPGSNVISVFTGEAREHFDYGLEKFIEEARILAQFNGHPCVVSVHGFFKENGTAYLIMDYLEGITLKDYLDTKGGSIPVQAGLEIIMPVMDALREVHNVGLLHRDISPENIYITGSKQVKLLDFGAARMAVGEQSRSLSVILKPGYAPEEQYRNKGKQGAWTDVYEVAATLYRSVTGKVPVESLERLEKDTLQPPSKLGVSISPEIEEALMKALSVKAGDRFQSMKEFQEALGTYKTRRKSRKKKVDKKVEEKRKKERKREKTEAQKKEKIPEEKTELMTERINSAIPMNSAASAEGAKKAERFDFSDFLLILRVTAILCGLIGLASWFDNYQRLNSLKVQYGMLVEEHDDLRQDFAMVRRQLRIIGAENGEGEIRDRYYQVLRENNKLRAQLKAAREELALANERKDLSLEVVSFELKNTGRGERPLSGNSVIFSTKEIRNITFFITLKNNAADVSRIRGRLNVKYINPDGSVKRNAKTSPPGYTLCSEFDLTDQTSISGRWGDDKSNIFQEGTNLVELWYEGRKLAEKKFVVF